ncbi:hypothetical protein E2C01_080063 [Portunus trituberculatus]|uniref:Uncharacterized protein n=1 Tax=Portunus trituberculatus TaxID=210409 RepID=A0A5B7IYI7_PORTR|nr:hypothetical protein [Portunus trituberculatus]
MSISQLVFHSCCVSLNPPISPRYAVNVVPFRSVSLPLKKEETCISVNQPISIAFMSSSIAHYHLSSLCRLDSFRSPSPCV